jgi:hypothetical protein
MFQRWAETRLYRKTMQIAVAELRRAARTANVLEKLEALEVAEQKLRDAQWLSPEEDRKRFDAGVGEITRSRSQTLDQAITAVERLLEAAEGGLGEQAEMLAPAGRILSFLNHYLPEDARVEVLNGRLLRLGGRQPPYTPAPALSEMYRRPAATVGCGSLIGLLALAAVVGAMVQVLR